MIKITPKQKKLIESLDLALALATCDSGNNPNVVGVACCRVFDNNKILITDNFMNKTRKNLLENNKAAVAVWSSNMTEGYQFKGKVEYLTKGKWQQMVNEDPENEGLAHKAAVLLHVEEIWDLVNPKLLASK
jgi:predicted pyridoxine 5'-phosphate oxidase superfamily flavin-nucleotide-binding protein